MLHLQCTPKIIVRQIIRHRFRQISNYAIKTRHRYRQISNYAITTLNYAIDSIPFLNRYHICKYNDYFCYLFTSDISCSCTPANRTLSIVATVPPSPQRIPGDSYCSECIRTDTCAAIPIAGNSTEQIVSVIIMPKLVAQ